MATATPTATKTQGPAILERREYDPSATKVAGVVETHTETEDALVEGIDKITDHTASIAERWAKRNATEGVKKFYNPLEPRDQRKLRDTEKEVKDELKKAPYKIQVEAAKLAKQDPKTYTPQFIIESPKRTLADFVGARHAHLAAASVEAARGVQNLGKLSREGTGREMTAGALMGMPESQASKRLNELSVEELKQVHHKATFGGKRVLTKAALKEINRRNETLDDKHQIVVLV